MKRLSIILLLATVGFACTFAQNGTGFVSNGYYRVCNLVTNRYVYVTDDKDFYDISRDVGDFQAIQLWKDINRAISDPASVIYIQKVSGDNYDLKAQGTGVHDLTGYYVGVKKQSNGTYEVSATAHGITKYLTDDEQSKTRAKGKMGTNGTGNYRKWIVDQLTTNHATNYFGITPSIELGGKYYQPFYASFPFKAVSPDMHIFYISDDIGELALLQEIEGEVPANTPVIIECASADPSQNRLELLISSSAKVTGNRLCGVYFRNNSRPKESINAYTQFNPTTMRVFSVSNGKLVLTNNAPDRVIETSVIDWSDPNENSIRIQCLPANTCYFKISGDTPDEIALTSDPTALSYVNVDNTDSSAEGVFTLSGTQLRGSNNVKGLPAGIYIVGGRKVVVK